MLIIDALRRQQLDNDGNCIFCQRHIDSSEAYLYICTAKLHMVPGTIHSLFLRIQNGRGVGETTGNHTYFISDITNDLE